MRINLPGNGGKTYRKDINKGESVSSSMSDVKNFFAVFVYEIEKMGMMGFG